MLKAFDVSGLRLRGIILWYLLAVGLVSSVVVIDVQLSAGEGPIVPTDSNTSQNSDRNKIASSDTLMLKPRKITFVITQNVILFEQKIITWDEVEKILDDSAKNGKIQPCFKSTLGGITREEELRENRWRLYKKLYDAGKIDGMTVGSLSPRASERLDRVRTAEDLLPDESRMFIGRVVDSDEKPVSDVEVFLLPEQHVNGVYLCDGRNRDPFEEHLTLSSAEGAFTVYPEDDETLIAVTHPAGFAMMTLDEFHSFRTIQLLPWSRVTGTLPLSSDDFQQQVDFTCYPVPGISFQLYETEEAADGSFDQKFLPPGKITVLRSLKTRQGGSMSFPIETVTLQPGQTHHVQIGKIPERIQRQVEKARKQ